MASVFQAHNETLGDRHRTVAPGEPRRKPVPRCRAHGKKLRGVCTGCKQILCNEGSGIADCSAASPAAAGEYLVKPPTGEALLYGDSLLINSGRVRLPGSMCTV